MAWGVPPKSPVDGAEPCYACIASPGGDFLYEQIAICEHPLCCLHFHAGYVSDGAHAQSFAEHLGNRYVRTPRAGD